MTYNENYYYGNINIPYIKKKNHKYAQICFQTSWTKYAVSRIQRCSAKLQL